MRNRPLLFLVAMVVAFYCVPRHATRSNTNAAQPASPIIQEAKAAPAKDFKS